MSNLGQRLSPLFTKSRDALAAKSAADRAKFTDVMDIIQEQVFRVATEAVNKGEELSNLVVDCRDFLNQEQINLLMASRVRNDLSSVIEPFQLACNSEGIRADLAYDSPVYTISVVE